MAARPGKTTTRLNLRSGPGTDQAIVAVLPAGAPLTILDLAGEWLHVEASGQEGFVNQAFVAQEQQAVPAGLAGTGSSDPFGDVPMAPAADRMIQLAAGASSAEKLVASTWNSCGNLLSALAGHLKFDPGAAVAVFCTESGGKGFGRDGRMIIRFENHHFFNDWGKAHPATFNAHFLFNVQKPWTGHQWSVSGAAFEDVHKDQNSEWLVFEFARSLDDTAAKRSISMGGPQILGSNYADAGFESVEQMFDAFSASEKRQIVGFFDFLQGTETHPRKVLALQTMDFIRFAELYNGPGNAAVYGARIAGTFDTFKRLLPESSAAVHT